MYHRDRGIIWLETVIAFSPDRLLNCKSQRTNLQALWCFDNGGVIYAMPLSLRAGRPRSYQYFVTTRPIGGRFCRIRSKPDLIGASYPRNYGTRWTWVTYRCGGTRVLSPREERPCHRETIRFVPGLCVGRVGIISETSSERVHGSKRPCWVPVRCVIMQQGLILPACSGSRQSDSRGSTSSFCFFAFCPPIVLSSKEARLSVFELRDIRATDCPESVVKRCGTLERKTFYDNLEIEKLWPSNALL